MIRSFFIILVMPSLVLAEPTTSMGGDPNNQDRRQDFIESRDEARKKNKEHFQPEMASKFMEAAKHFKDAQEARQQKNEGKAKQDEMMGQMKQMQGQQLQQQIQANEDSAKKNDMGAQKLKNPEQVKVPTVPGNTLVISLRDPNYSSQPGAATPMASEAPKPPIPSEQLADLGQGKNFVAALSPKVEKAETPPAKDAPGDTTREKFGYDENAKPSTTNGPINTASTAASGAPATPTASNAPTLLTSVTSGGTAGGAGAGGTGDFWKGLGAMVDDENQQAAAKDAALNPLNLRGKKEKVPGAGLSDKEFWKKVGKIPAKCKGAARQDACLRTARREYERKWREQQRKPASTPEKPAEKPSLQAKGN